MKKHSTKCGKDNCEHYNRNNQISKCNIYDDRNNCAKSKKQIRNTIKKAKEKGDLYNRY